MKEERKNTWFYAKAINVVYYNGVMTINKCTYGQCMNIKVTVEQDTQQKPCPCSQKSSTHQLSLSVFN